MSFCQTPRSLSPNGPSSRRFSAPHIQNSTLGLEKAYKSVRFSEYSRVMMIPSRHACLAPDMDLWWTPMDYHGFKQMRAQESNAGMDLISFNFQKNQAQDEFIDIRVLIISNESVLTSSLTRNLAAALARYETELNENTNSVDGNAIDKDNTPQNSTPPSVRYRRVRSSVTQVAHNSKEYALAMQGMMYNVIVFDSGRRMTPLEEMEKARQDRDSSLDEHDRDEKQAGSYIVSTANSYLVKPEQGCSVSASVNVSSLLLSSGSADASEIPCDENHLLKKIIKAGTALGYICEDPSIVDLDADLSTFNECGEEEEVDVSSSPRRRRSQPLCIPPPSSLVSCFGTFTTNATNLSTSPSSPGPSPSNSMSSCESSINHSVQGRSSHSAPGHYYSLLKDHADVVLDPSDVPPVNWERESFSSTLSSSPLPPPLCTPPPHPPSFLPLHRPPFGSSHSRERDLGQQGRGSSNRVLSAEDWLLLFRVTAARTAPPSITRVSTSQSPHSVSPAAFPSTSTTSTAALPKKPVSLLSLSLRGES